jgi:hypothetical protein
MKCGAGKLLFCLLESASPSSMFPLCIVVDHVRVD